MLSARGIDPFLDVKKLKAGDIYGSEFQERIRQAYRRAKEFHGL
jgi:hypothetical protein